MKSKILTQVYIDEIYGDAQKKGWWEKPLPMEDLLMLVVTELAEAVEEVRNKKPSLYYNHPAGGDLITDAHPQGFSQLLKPEGAAVELADVWIRLADIAGHSDVVVEDLPEVEHTWQFSNEFPLGNYFAIVRVLVNSWHYKPPYHLHSAMVITEALAEFHGFDLKQAIDIKIAYNRTRSYKHGGKLC